MGQLLGKEKLFSYLDLFGFGEKTAIDLNLKVESLIRVLQNEFVQMNYGQIIYEYVSIFFF